jgi:chromosome segregation ATPase
MENSDHSSLMGSNSNSIDAMSIVPRKLLAERAMQISERALLVHTEIAELHRALQIAERDNKIREQALEAQKQQTKDLLAEADRKIEKAKQESVALAQQYEKREAQMQREYSALAAQVSEIKSNAAAFIAQARLGLNGFSDTTDRLSRELQIAVSAERSARIAEQERMQAAMDAANTLIAEKDDGIEELEQRNADLASKLYAYQLQVKEAEDRFRRMDEDKAGLARQVAEHADTIRSLKLDIHEREREQQETKEKLVEANRISMETKEDLAGERRMLEAEKLRSNAAEVLIAELKAQQQAQAATVADLRQQLAACTAALQRATQEAAVCRDSLDQCRARLADSDERLQRTAADLAAAEAAGASMHRALCRTAVAVCRGVGLVLGSDADGRITVLRVLDGGAADTCGSIRSGDAVLEVDGSDVRSRSVSDVESLLAGPAGSSVTVLLEATARQWAGSDLSTRPGPATASVTLVREGEDSDQDAKGLDRRATEAVSVAEDMRRELEELRRRCASTGSALAEALARLEGSRRVEALLRDSAERERAARATEVRAYEERCAGKEATIAALQDEVAALRQAVAARVGDLNRAMAAADKAAEAHAAERKRLERDLEDALGRLRASTKECTDKDEVIAQLRRELEALRLRFDAVERDCRSATAAAEQQRDAALARLRKQGEETQRLTAALEAASEVEAALRAALLEAEARAREELAAVRGECSEKDAEIAVLRGRLESARASETAMEQAMHDMEARLAAAQRAEADARAALDASEREGRALAERVQALEAEVARLTGLCGRREETIRLLEERLAQAALTEAALREQLQKEREAAEAALRACREDSGSKDSDMERLRYELSALRSELEKLRAALAAAEARAAKAEAGLAECRCAEKDAQIRDLQVRFALHSVHSVLMGR